MADFADMLVYDDSYDLAVTALESNGDILKLFRESRLVHHCYEVMEPGRKWYFNASFPEVGATLKSHRRRKPRGIGRPSFHGSML